MTQVKEQRGGGEGRKFPSFPSPLFHFLTLISFLARPKPVFLCSETKWKRLLRRLREICHCGLWKDLKGLIGAFYGCEKDKNTSWFFDWLTFNGIAFTAVKRDASFKLSVWLEYHWFFNRRYGNLFCQKWFTKGWGVRPRWYRLPIKKKTLLRILPVHVLLNLPFFGLSVQMHFVSMNTKYSDIKVALAKEDGLAVLGVFMEVTFYFKMFFLGTTRGHQGYTNSTQNNFLAMGLLWIFLLRINSCDSKHLHSKFSRLLELRWI